MEIVNCPDYPARDFEYSERPALASLYAVAGRFICVECGDEESAGLFRRYFTDWHVSPLGDVEAVSRDATIFVNAGEVLPRPPAGFESFEIAGGGICRTDGRTYFFVGVGS